MPRISDLQIRQIPSELTLDLRQRVLWPHLSIDQLELPDDEAALHLGGFSSDRLICVASFFISGAGHRLRKFAVAPEFQGLGVGTRLLEYAASFLRDRGSIHIWCDARTSASDFYHRNGFELSSEIFEKGGVSYQKAIRTLK